jgi:hypothetical protein
MSNTAQPSFLSSLVRATTSALQSAQREFFQEWSAQRQGGTPTAPIKVVSVAKTAANTPAAPGASASPTASVKAPPTISPERLAYLRSVYLKPPLRPAGGSA